MLTVVATLQVLSAVVGLGFTGWCLLRALEDASSAGASTAGIAQHNVLATMLRGLKQLALIGYGVFSALDRTHTSEEVLAVSMIAIVGCAALLSSFNEYRMRRQEGQ